MIAAWVATLGPGPEAGRELDNRLQRLRLDLGQKAWHYTFGELRIGLLAHPVLPLPPGFEPQVRVDGHQFAILSGAPQPDWLQRLPADRKRLESTLAQHGGPWLLLVVEPAGRRLQVYRDPLGDRAAFYRRLGQQHWLSSDELALLDDGHALRPAALAVQFALAYPPPQQSPFESIDCLPAGHGFELSPDGISAPQRYWRFRRDPLPRRTSDAELRTRYVELLDQAVARAAGDHPVAIAVSGGMDSTAIASCPGLTQPVRLATYRPTGWPQCDESAYARELAESLGYPIGEIETGALGPMSDAFMATPTLETDFATDAYRAMRHSLINEAAESGHGVILTGDFADQLFCGYFYALRDLVQARRWRQAAQGLRNQLRSSGLRWLSNPLLRRMLPLNGVTRGWRRHLPPWLTAVAIDALPPLTSPFDPVDGLREPDRVEAALNSLTARGAHLGYLQGLSWGAELRFPFRDLPLVEFVLNLPGWQLFDPATGQTKALARRALADRLPTSIAERPDKTSLEPLFREAVLRQHRRRVDRLLSKAESWREFVRQDWLEQQISSPDPSSAALYTLWNCIGLSLWQRRALKFDGKAWIDTLKHSS